MSLQKSDNKPQPRVAFIDLAKGICILLVVLYHIDSREFGLPNFDALRMPLYFVLSGLFFKTYGSIFVFSLKKINNMVVPFLFWMLVSYGCMFLYRYAVRHQIEPFANFWIGFDTHNIYLNRPLWFLVCLPMTHLLFYLLHRFLNGAGLLAGVLLLAVFGNIVAARGYYLPLWIDSACTAMPFFYMGYLLKESPLLRGEIRWPLSLSAGLLCIGAAYLLWFLFDAPVCSFRTNTIEGNRLVLYLDSLLFVLGVLLVCKVVRWLPLLSYWGRYSIVILCVHGLFIRYIPAVCKLNDLPVSPIGIRMLILLLCCFSIPFCKTLLPWFVAQKPLLKPVKNREILKSEMLESGVTSPVD